MATLPTNRTEGNTDHVADHNELHDGHNLSETHRNHAAPHSGHETPAGAQAKADAAQAAAATDATTKANAAATAAQSALNTHMADTDAHGIDASTVITEADLAAYEITAQRVTVVPGGALGSTDVQGALEELVDEIGGSTTAAHIADTTNAHAASAIGVTPSGNLAADDVQEALTEIQTDVDTRATSAALTAHIDDASAAHAATAIAFTPAGTIAATTVQAAVEEVASSVGDLLNWQVAQKTSAQSVTSSTTLTDATELLLPIGANEVWVFDGFLYYFSPAAADLKLAFTVPAGCDIKWGGAGGAVTAAGVGDGNWQRAIASGADLVFGGYTTAAVTMQFRGIVTNGATAGNLQLQFAQSVSDATNTTISTGSHIIGRRIS